MEGKQDVNEWDIRGLEGRIESARTFFSNIIHDYDLGNAFSALYIAEEAPEEKAALKQTNYLAALLGTEAYIARTEQEVKDGRMGSRIPQELDTYLGICRELSDYCRSKVSYLKNDEQKKAR